MRRKEKELTESAAIEILKQAVYATVSMIDPEGKPYAVLVNLAYDETDQVLFFHCALKGKKLDCLLAHPQVFVSACTVAKVKPEHYSTQYQSACAWGKAVLVESEEKKRYRLEQLCRQFVGNRDDMQDEINKSIRATALVEIKIEGISGKGSNG